MEQYCKHSAEALRTAWQTLKDAEPALRIRDAAQRLGVSEAELLALGCGQTVTRLEAEWAELIRSLPRLERVMALTRNDLAVHEKHGRYVNEADGQAGTEDALDLRLVPERWRFGFAVIERGHGGERHSLQFFTADGEAAHKVYLTEASHAGNYENLVEHYTAPDQSPWQAVASEADAPSFDDLHLRQRREQLQALRLAEPERAWPVAVGAAERVLTLAAQESIPLVIEVAGPGAVQYHRGPVQHIRRTGPWINVLDEDFNLHLRDTAVASSWVVRETLPAGDALWLELLDDQGRTVVRIGGEAEPNTWRDVLTALPTAESPV
ncbi:MULTISPECIES: hemin-degrading factor [Methylomicrobium]|uniref:Putative heme degradation protein n=1 Tax=Methylomicrobium album BG8 TaxID=686340 RepID=H8GJ27_METAL|nr:MULTISPECIES: hemin-degrading factor [Methylomicrobium]EIC31534.1 putative heme degradation protein [Methylomicrobium album BG8]